MISFPQRDDFHAGCLSAHPLAGWDRLSTFQHSFCHRGSLALLYLWLLLRSNLDQNGAFATLQETGKAASKKPAVFIASSGIRNKQPTWLGAAQAFFLHNWAAGLSMLAAIFILYAVRIPREERRMLAAFGESTRSTS